MSDAFVGEIRLFAGNFAPNGWAFCNGQLLPIQQNTALFSLLGTNYGGNGRSTFGLPDFRDRLPLHQGQGPGLTPRQVGDSGGQAGVTLQPAEIPSHTHALLAASSPSTGTPGPGVALAPVSGGAPGYRIPIPGHLATLAPASVALTGGNQPHLNQQPYLGLSFIIALQGIFPPRA
jgi:microcystin-dependent protein